MLENRMLEGDQKLFGLIFFLRFKSAILALNDNFLLKIWLSQVQLKIWLSKVCRRKVHNYFQVKEHALLWPSNMREQKQVCKTEFCSIRRKKLVEMQEIIQLNVPENCFANINDILSWFCYKGYHLSIILKANCGWNWFCSTFEKAILSAFLHFSPWKQQEVEFSLYCF